MRAKEAWQSFYESVKLGLTPSSFAKFFVSFAKRNNLEGKKLIDVGCGNGRDLFYLTKTFEATGVDWVCALNSPHFVQIDIFNNLKILEDKDIVYSRFFLHCVSDDQIKLLVDNTKEYFVAEARANGDTPVIYPEHKRNFITPAMILTLLMSSGFEIEYFVKERGVSFYKNEDPLVIRVIAKRCNIPI